MRRLLSKSLLLMALFPALAPALTLKIATVAPEGTRWMQEMRAGAREIASRTNGRVKLKFYPGGVMGNDKSVLKKIRLGQLHGGALTGGSLARVYPDMQIYSLPMEFNTLDEVDAVRREIDPVLRKGMEQHGFVILGLAEGGFAYLMSSDPITRIEELRQHKVWVPEDDLLSYVLFRKMGVQPITLPLADVYTSLQTGLIDTVGATPVGAIAFQWHTRLKSVTNQPLMYLVGALVVDKKRFSRIRPADRKVVMEVMDGIFRRLDRANRSDNAAALATLRQRGFSFVTPSTEEVARWKRLAEEAIAEEEGIVVSKALHQRLRRLLAEYRAQRPERQAHLAAGQ
ncbi:MAG: C4-dicarboxylate ABC transporter [Gammaproteobacteria bacterium]|nr:MAG: C4-dicarboxylate ABC transporter [Gammaproteobacteria bacterium]